jgi:ABC-2 type transport system ATP-binding protein
LIEVQNLTKAYGLVTAVDHVSFTVNKGEILGFLGPNGAGKTTTMRILTGFMPATSGTARVSGFDVATDSLEVRRHIGYLPEAPPLYPDMSVGSYLDFVLRIKNIPVERRRARVDDALEKTNLGDKRNELIKRLSRRLWYTIPMSLFWTNPPWAWTPSRSSKFAISSRVLPERIRSFFRRTYSRKSA